MKLWIPDIGDKIILTADWTFDVVNESRNAALWKVLDLDKHPRAIEMRRLAAEKLEEARKFDESHRTVKVEQRWGFIMNFDSKANEKRSEEIWAEYSAVRDPVAPTTFPKGTALIIDRVYIRKGASEFSSLSFFIGNSPMKELEPVKKGGRWPSGPRRFFARLADVNKIECDVLDA